MTLLAIFNLRQKVYRCIYTHFDVSKIYKSLKSWSAITLNLNKKTKWVNGVMGQRVLPLLNFQYWSYDYFFTKNRYSWISHANLAIWWWRSSKISSSTAVDQLQQNCISCNDSVLNSNYSWIFLCYFSNNKKTYWWFIDYISNICYLIL